LNHGQQFVKHVVPAVIKPARTLWHEVIGFLFLSLGIIFLFGCFRAYREGNLIALIMSAFLVVLMGGYGISSFLRARRISRT
jgi:hypothetical protein